MVSKHNIARNFGRSAHSYNAAATVQQAMAAELAKHIASTGFRPQLGALEIGCGTGLLTSHLAPAWNETPYYANDISDSMLEALLRNARMPHIQPLCADAETAPWPAPLDAIVSSAAVQWFAQPLSIVHKAAQALPHGGLLAIATFGTDTFRELTQQGISGLSYPTLQQWRDALEPHFGITVAQSSLHTLHFADARSLMQSIKDTGATATNQHLSPAQIRRVMHNLDTLCRTEHGIPLTYHTIILVGRKK